jgi:lipopolysaccharide transport system permease protein
VAGRWPLNGEDLLGVIPDGGLWDEVITPRRAVFSLDLGEVWRYRDLLLFLVRRDFVAQYKQTILGPLWYFVQPLLTTLMFVLVFHRIARLPTDGVPPMLFYLAGITGWNYFAECLTKTSTTFRDNQHLFGKVYFPRLVVPLSIVISGFVKFVIQMVMFLAVYLWVAVSGAGPRPMPTLALFPVVILLLAGMGLGFGLVITSLTTKYRDLVFLIQFGVQLAMYATPVIYPLSSVPEHWRLVVAANPMAPLVELIRHGFLGRGTW